MENFINEATDTEVAEILRNTGKQTSSQEAVKEITRAESLGLHPDNYLENKDNLQPEVEIAERVPAQVSEPIKNHMKKSTQHAEAVKDEIGTLEVISKQIKYIGYNLFQKQNLESEIEELNEKGRNSDKGLEPHEADYLEELYNQQEEKIESFKTGDSIGEEILPGIAGVVNDMARTVGNNKLLIAGGAAAGFFTPVPFGGAAGAGGAFTVALAKDAYFRTANSVYGDLRRMRDENGVLMDLDQDTMQNVSASVGVTAGVLEGLTGKVLTGGLKKLASPKLLAQKLVKSNAARLFGHTVKSAITSGGEEVAAEITTILGENFARGSKDEEGLLNAMSVTAQQIANDPEVRKRLQLSGTIGAAAGGAIAGGTGVVASRIGKKRQARFDTEVKNEQERIAVTKEALKVLNAQNDILDVAGKSLETDLKNLTPEQMTELRKDMFAESGYKDKMWFSENDLATLEENNPDLAEKIRNMDATQSSEDGTGSPVGIQPYEFLDLVEEAPEVAEYMRLNPEGPSPLESRSVLENFKQAEEARNEILSSLGVDEELTPEQIQTLNELDASVEESVREAGETAYVETFEVPENIKDAIPEKQLENYSNSQRKAREDVALQLKEEFDAAEQRIENRIVRANEKITKKLQLEKHREEIELVEKFKVKKGFSELAIDPTSLPEDLRDAYLSNDKLKKRKVFSKEGISLEESAALAGFDKPLEMLKTLANAPTKKEMLEQRRAKSAEVRKQVQETRAKSKDDRLDAVFDKTANFHKREMEFMKSKEWGQTKSGVRKVVLPLPQVADLNNTAKGIVNKTTVKDLSPRQFNAGEKTQQRKYTSHILNNEVEQAFKAKEKALLNHELTRESIRASKKIRDARKVVKRMTSRSGKAALKNAGLDKKANAILDLFNMNPSSEKQARRQESYRQYIQRLDQEGQSVQVPENLADIRQRGEDMNVQQFLAVAETLQTYEHQARMKNKLYKIQEKRAAANKLQTEEAIVTDAAEDLQSHPSFKEDRYAETVKNQNSKGFMQRTKEKFSLGGAALTNLKNVVNELDRDSLSGVHQDNIAEPLVKSETAKRARLQNVVGQIKNIAENYGKKEFDAAFNDFIKIPEFEGFRDLGNGSMARSDMWTLFMTLGDPQGVERLNNFVNSKTGETMTVDKIQRVLDQHLTEKDAKLAQNFTNIFKTFEDEAKALHLRTTGVEPNMVKGLTITHRGKVYEGGYTPLNYLRADEDVKVERFLDLMGEKEASMFGKKGDDSRLYAAMRSAEQTEQGRLADRTGSTLPLDLSFMNILQGYEEHVHDISYRESGMDTLKLVKNPVYEQSIKNVVGNEKYEVIVNGIIETVGKVDNDRTLSPFDKDRRMINSVYKYLEQGFAINALGFNIKSVLMQPLSLGTAKLRMGPKASRYLSKSMAQAMSAFTSGNYEQFFNDAIEVNPDLATGRDNIDDTLTKSTYGDIKQTENINEKFRTLKDWKKKFEDTSMVGLQKVDIQIKAAVSLAAYSQFVNGDVKNFPKSKIDNMSVDQRHAEAKRYVKQVADLALTTSADIDKSGVEKVALMRMFTRFYTDVRSQLNTGMSQGRKIRNAIIEGNPKEAALDATALMMVYGLNKAYVDTLYDKENPISDLAQVEDFDSFANYLTNTAAYTLKAPADVFVGSIPVARDFQFALGSDFGRKKFNTWVGRAFTDVTLGIVALNDWMAGEELDGRDMKSLASAGGLLVRGLPVNGISKIHEAIQESESVDMATGFIASQVQQTAKRISKFIDKHDGNPKKQEQVDYLKDIQKQLPLNDQGAENVIPEDSIEVLKTNNWDDVNPDTGAAGVYQFTEEQWNQIIENAPELGLTENGRVSKDQSQQEKAMSYSLKENAKALTAYQVEVNNKNLFGAHRFGVDDFTAILLSEDNEKIEDIVSDIELFKGFKTVKQVKDYVGRTVK